MRLALGDVVRDRTDMAIGTVIGVTTQAEIRRVAVYVPGSPIRLTAPYDLDVLAHHSSPTARGRGWTALAVVVLAALAAVLGCQYARTAGADWLLMFLAGLGSFGTVTTAYQWWVRLTGPRRFRV